MTSSYRIFRRSLLRYASNDPAGAHLSAASGVAVFGDDLVIVNDASTFAGVFPTNCSLGRSLRLLPSVEGHDHFLEADGTKLLKPDLEVLLPLPDGKLLAMGSGSRPRGKGDRKARCTGVKIDRNWRVEIVSLKVLFDSIAEFQPDLNLEGAVTEGDGLLLFLRGNGPNAEPTLLTLLDLEDALDGHPRFGSVRPVSLGDLEGVKLGFTDACRLEDGRCFAALAAENSPSAYGDGEVKGSALFDVGAARIIPLLDEDGKRFAGKLEGICPLPGKPRQLYGVTDPDEPSHPGELLLLEASDI